MHLEVAGFCCRFGSRLVIDDWLSTDRSLRSLIPPEKCIPVLPKPCSSRLPSSIAFVTLLGLSMCLLIAPHLVLAGGTGPDLGLQSALIQVRKFLTGPVVTAAATVAMVGVLYGIIIRSQRGESISSLAAIACSLILITNIEELMDLIGASAGSSMISAESVTFLSVVVEWLSF